jgi:photosystem I P700 chlorophyll a apoprotein A1
MQALSRPQDMFADNAIALKPLFAAWVQSLRVVGYDLQVLGNKVVVLTQELGSADFIVHHIHAFTIHCTILILFKGGLYARCSSLVSDKIDLGFRYPCDGPGRGGTCQISPWDHSFLGLFWMYNCLSVVIFHFFWKMQSDVWGNYQAQSMSMSGAITHISASDFSTNAGTVNGWLRNFLWSFSTQVIQSYGTELTDYGLIFLLAHFLWAFSLMFLFSGRGYWQELIEAIVYAHYKLKIVAKIQPRALSITHGRAAGLTHYLIGGIGTTNTFILARMISLN